jgi:hypothetical protein
VIVVQGGCADGDQGAIVGVVGGQGAEELLAEVVQGFAGQRCGMLAQSCQAQVLIAAFDQSV